MPGRAGLAWGLGLGPWRQPGDASPACRCTSEPCMHWLPCCSPLCLPLLQDAESGLYYDAEGKPLAIQPGAPGGPPHPNGLAAGSSGTGSWLPCFRSHSQEVRHL